MSKKYLSIISLLLSIVMIAGILSACGGKSETVPTSKETEGTAAESQNESATGTEGGAQNETTAESVTADETSESATDSGSGNTEASESETSDTTDSSEGTEATDSSETKGVDVVENEYDPIIDNAYGLSNGVQGYFTNEQRTHLVLENQQIELIYARANSKDQLVTSLKNKRGNSYIENTMDAFVTMKNGNTFYASQSNINTISNFFRLGYYYYEARIEGQNFTYKVFPENTRDIDIKIETSNGIGKDKISEDGTLSFMIKPDSHDPWFVLKNTSYAADEYNYIQFTMKTTIDTVINGQVFYKANGATAFSEASSVSYPIMGDGEFHTYVVKLEGENYKGDVTSLRIDVAGNAGSTCEIKDIKLIKGDNGGTPENLSIVRSFLVYSDKMHSFIQFASKDVATTDIASLGYETRIPKSDVSKVIVMDADGLHESFDGVDWSSAEYVGFDITEAGIFGFILPIDGVGGKLEVKDDGENYIVIQSNTPENGTILPSVEGTDNANDYYIGQRIYTDDTHSFDDFIYEAYNERNPIKTIAVNTSASTGGDVIKYDALRGIYSISIDYDTFGPAYYQWPNKHYNVKFAIRGDGRERNIYLMTLTTGLCLETAALLDKNDLMLPLPIQVGKNFSEKNGERNLYNMDDVTYSEAIIPIVLTGKEKYEFNMLNLYQNWGKVPLKQISWIQFYAPVYHLSTGVIETNCIVPWGGMRNTGSILNTLPDHRAMSAPFWADQPQHSSGGTHHWLLYTDAEGNYSSSENISNIIDSFGPTYADIAMEYISHDGKISVTYTHTEMPQTDENRAYYEMKYTILEDISFKDFAHSFSFYTVTDNDPTGLYQNVGYLNADNECVVVDSNLTEGTHVDYPLGNECPYFSFFNMENYTSTSQQGYVNLSFLIANAEFTIGGEKAEPQFLLVNYYNYLTLTLNLDEVTFKAGDTFTINAIVMPWGSQKSVYDSDEFAPDWNVRAVRENSLLNRVTATPLEGTEAIESVFVPKVKSTDGKTATFTLTGGCKNKSAEIGNHNIAIRAYGFERITAPVIEELVDGEWVVYEVSSANTPDRYGNAHAYDGYCIYKDPDGTYSYSFVVDMTEGEDRTFRISADKEFTGWPEIEIQDPSANDPIEKYFTASEIIDLAASASSSCESIALSADEKYVRFMGLKDRALEATFNLFSNNEKETGQYIVLKYRIPEDNEKDLEYLEFWTSTEFETPSQSKKYFRIKTSALYDDGDWHVAIIDLTDWNNEVFKANDDGKYYAKFLRFDVFNSKIGANTGIDIAVMGMGSSLETILEQFPEMQTASIYTTDTQKITVDVATGEEVEEEIGGENGGEEELIDPIEKYFTPGEIIDLAASASSSCESIALSSDKKYVRFKGLKENALEAVFNLFSGNEEETGQYIVLKYRLPKDNEKDIQYLEFWTATEFGSPQSGKYFRIKSSALYADGDWHIAIIDLTDWNNEAFKAADDGKYYAKFLRFDVFNAKIGANTGIDIAVMGMGSSLETILEQFPEMQTASIYTTDTQKTTISVATGEEVEEEIGTPGKGAYINGEDDGETDDTVEKIGVTHEITASDIYEKAQTGTLMGKLELLENDSYTRFYTSTKYRELYFTPFRKDSTPSGQYFIIKYRTEDPNAKLEVWSSTENMGATPGDNQYLRQTDGVIIADGEWHTIVLDLSGWKTVNAYKGVYDVNYIRFDLFDYDAAAPDENSWIDIAFMAFCDDYDTAISYDNAAESVQFYNGSQLTTVSKAE